MDTPDDSSLRAWEALKRRLPIDSRVSGVVVRKEPYGAWLDIGAGFPTLIEIIYIDGLTPEKYQAGDWCPVGSTVEAFVMAFVDGPDPSDRQIRLWQVISERLWDDYCRWRQERGMPPPPAPRSTSN